MYLASEPAGILAINGTFLIEIVAFILMILVLAKYAYPRISAAAEARQQTIGRQLEEAERSRREAQEQLEQAKIQLDQARAQAQEVIDGASKSGEQARAELKAKGEEEAARLVEKAKKDIDIARQQAVESVRAQVADLVVMVTQKVIGETVDAKGHKRLIDEAIKEVEVGQGH